MCYYVIGSVCFAENVWSFILRTQKFDYLQYDRINVYLCACDGDGPQVILDVPDVTYHTIGWQTCVLYHCVGWCSHAGMYVKARNEKSRREEEPSFPELVGEFSERIRPGRTCEIRGRPKGRSVVNVVRVSERADRKEFDRRQFLKPPGTEIFPGWIKNIDKGLQLNERTWMEEIRPTCIEERDSGSGGPSQDREIKKNRFNPLENRIHLVPTLF